MAENTIPKNKQSNGKAATDMGKNNPLETGRKAANDIVKNAVAKAKDTQSNKYQLTINNAADYGWTHEKIFETARDNFKTLSYLCMADEMGSTFHTHIFLCFNSRVRFSTLKRHFPEAHIEKCRGMVSDNVNYIRKSGKWKDDIKHGTKIEGSFEEFGTRPPDSRGKREDMSELYQMVEAGMTDAEILAENQDYILNISSIGMLRTTLLMEKFKNTRRTGLKACYVCGATGQGKTRGILDEHGDSNVYRVTDYQHPFDGYQRQPVIAFDEFRCSLKISDMLDYLDIYPLQLPARYSDKYACYDAAYIISNWELEKQYPEVQKDSPETWKAFLRRIHTVKVYHEDGRITVYDSVGEYLKRNEAFHPLEGTEQQELPFREG